MQVQFQFKRYVILFPNNSTLLIVLRDLSHVFYALTIQRKLLL